MKSTVSFVISLVLVVITIDAHPHPNEDKVENNEIPTANRTPVPKRDYNVVYPYPNCSGTGDCPKICHLKGHYGGHSELYEEPFEVPCGADGGLGDGLLQEEGKLRSKVV
ncbi:hypothetical protein QAD02_011911 [Eretmocerus hayati]|uniref:Uncharacterized protein n=1 Tax=Eretmocerus hayati TaxID=131215 RepID=A0ACC2P2W9_9HYME|nr:hypothetical protein QAD02_011911 [Eretmocerus hayati]